jgi:hypothetical protein
MVSKEASGRCVDGEVAVVLQHQIRYRLSIIEVLWKVAWTLS